MLRKWKKECGLGHKYELFAVLVHLRQPLFLHEILSHFDLQIHQVNREEKRSQHTFPWVFVALFCTVMSRIGTLHAQQAKF